MKAIKLSETHYIVVDDSKRGYRGYNYNFALSRIDNLSSGYKEHTSEWNWCYKITHSTQPLENGIGKSINGTYPPEYPRFDKIKPLSLLEIEEAIYGYSVEKMAKDLDKSKCRNFKREHTSEETYDGIEDGFILGFNAHKELVKDKLFTMEDVEKIWKYALYCAETHNKNNTKNKSTFIENDVNEFIQSLLPKTEWEIKEITPESKIVLL